MPFFLAIHDGPADKIELILPGRFSFVHCEKHSDVFRTRQKKRRELQQLVQNTILAIKCSRQYFLSDYLLHRSASGGILPVNWRDSSLSDVDGFELIHFFLLAK